jgi:hypothetical protein
VWQSRCSTATVSFPFAANSGTIAATRSAGSRSPSCTSSQAAAETIAFVQENAT